MTEPIEIVYPFEKYPFFGCDKRPTPINGTVRCELVKISGNGQNEPVRLTWRVTEISCRIGTETDSKEMIDFDGDQQRIDAFCLWLKLRHGNAIAEDLRAIHHERQKGKDYV